MNISRIRNFFLAVFTTATLAGCNGGVIGEYFAPGVRLSNYLVVSWSMTIVSPAKWEAK